MIRALSLAALCVGCGSNKAGSFDLGGTPAGDLAGLGPVGSGTVVGPDGFTVRSAVRMDDGTVGDRVAVTVMLADDNLCYRPSACANERFVLMHLYGAPHAPELVPGPLGGATMQSFDFRVGGVTVQTNGCDVHDQPSSGGTATLDLVTSTELKGSFSVDIPGGNLTTTHLTGSFDAFKCL